MMLIKWERSATVSQISFCTSVIFSVVPLSMLQLDAGSFLQLLCLAEDIRTDQWDVSSLLRLNGCDMRQSLLQLQFWTRSGGGRHATRPLSYTVKNGKEKKCMKKLE